MEVFVKRENWNGGIWMKLPVSEEQAEQVLDELAGYHPSRMIPFIGDVEVPVAGLAHLLIGEFVFQDSNLGQLNYLAAKLGSWSEQERAVFETVLQNEKPDSLLLSPKAKPPPHWLLLKKPSNCSAPCRVVTTFIR